MHDRDKETETETKRQKKNRNEEDRTIARRIGGNYGGNWVHEGGAGEMPGKFERWLRSVTSTPGLHKIRLPHRHSLYQCSIDYNATL